MDRREFLQTSGLALAAAATGGAWPRLAHAVAGDELARLDATDQAALVRRKEVTPLELVDAAIARIERLNPRLNAVVTTLFERGREAAKRPLPQGLFTGVPYLLKDLHAYQGARVTFGSTFFRNHVASYTLEVIRRTEGAGLVVLGFTNSPEFGLLPTTEPVLHGATRNPWAPERSAGGSSGGAAAAVAAGLVPVAQASDGGGSIRIPASACGIFGLKPSRGRNPQAPEVDLNGLSVRHCVSRSVRDSAALLGATRGPVPGDRWWAPPPPTPYLKEIESDPKSLRVAFATTDFLGRKVHADCVAAVESTAALCADLGHRVEEAKPDIQGAAFNEAFLLLWSTYAGEVIKLATRKLGHKPPADAFEPFTWQLADLEARHTPADLSGAWDLLQRAVYRVAGFMTRYDVFLTPTLGAPPLRLGEIDQSVAYETLSEQLTRYVPFTPIANVTGQPAMSMPLHWNEAGVPIGSHFLGRFGDEGTLFRLAAQLERARPWAKRRPRIWAGAA